MVQKVFRTGNSLAVTIPSRFAQVIGIRKGDKVEVELNREKGRILYRFSGVQQLPLGDLLTKRKIRK